MQNASALYNPKPNSDAVSKSVTVTSGGTTPDYCTATHLYDYGYINNVTVGTIDRNSRWGTNGYADYTAQSTTMQVGTGYPITIGVENDHWSHNVVAVWVDWNQDGDFEDAGESIYAVEAADPYSATITPPAHAFSGSTRMRVRLLYWKAATPCGADNYFGDVEDYTIIIQ